MDVPVIETARLRLRAHRRDDFDAVAAMWADPAVVEHIGGVPSARDRSWMRLLTYLGLWPALGYGYWAVEERVGGEYIGDVGIADFKRVMTPSIAGEPETGWVLRPAMHGRGYAREAVHAALQWADTNLTAPRTVCIINPPHRRSIALAEAVGYVQIAAAHFNGPVLLFERARYATARP